MALKIKTNKRNNPGIEEAKKEILKKDLHRMNILIDKDIFHLFKKKAMEGYTTPSALMRQWVSKYIQD